MECNSWQPKEGSGHKGRGNIETVVGRAPLILNATRTALLVG